MTNLRYRSYVQLRQSIDQLYHQQAVRLGLPDSVLWLVVSLYERGQACTPTELYADCAMSKQTGHSALQWLEKRELIRLIPDDTDRRSKRAELTAAGSWRIGVPAPSWRRRPAPLKRSKRRSRRPC